MAQCQGARKSPVDETVLEVLLEELTNELPSDCQKELRRDIESIQTRFRHEGLGFLTRTLPSLAEAIDRSFELGSFSLPPDLGFKAKKGWKTPAFMQCFFSRVYDSDGRLLDCADPYCVYALRQVLNLYKKIERPVGDWCKPAVSSFVKRAEEPRPFQRWADLRCTTARRYLSYVLADLDPFDIVGKHGPGVVADRIPNDLRWDTLTWPEGADWLWPRREHFVPQLVNVHDALQRIERSGSLPSRLICVPKTSKTPRLIAAEPAGLQFLQGGLAEKLVNRVESCWLTAGFVNFRDQTINQRIAREGAINGTWCTIDLSDASDSLGHRLVQELFPTEVGVALDILRCKEIQYEEHTVCPTFFASMGSALTFPVESLAFAALCVGAIMGEDPRYRPGQSTEMDDESKLVGGPGIEPRHLHYYARARRHLYVYGDDIIVSTEYATAVLEVLRDFGFTPNISKTFTTGPFRESCGTDWFRATNVRPIYIRKYVPRNRKDVSRITSVLEAANQFADQGLRRTARAIYDLLGNKFPNGPSNAAYLCQRFGGKTPKSRYNRNTQTREVLVPCLKKPRRRNKASECGRYLAALTGRETSQTSFRSDRADRSYINIRWEEVAH